MIVYTVHPESIYKMMREQGYYEGSRANFNFKNSFERQYDWMVAQMKKRLSHYEGDEYPVWVWKRRPGRNESALLPRGTRGVILKLEIPDEDILWSDFESWHLVLNEGPYTTSEKEWEDHLQNEWSTERVEKSWEMIFDFDKLSNLDPRWNGTFDPEWIQGVTPRITMDQVKKVTRFVAKGPKRNTYGPPKKKK
ncbi:DUF3841 domain-containing protein [Viridibacillus sp. NPDC093762]|uniref:DUF3841 domain-containing protein n=1 Tax=Viridibacillus sp. NPDC093762 TaxID=3390720 RepID=UPI003D025BD1